MAVLSGTAKIRFGAADTFPDMHENTHGSAWEAGGIVLQAEAGDVFVIPAGVAHKTHDTKPEAEIALLSPGRRHGIEAEDPAEALSKIRLEGFTMMGAYCGKRGILLRGAVTSRRCGAFRNRGLILFLGIRRMGFEGGGREVALLPNLVSEILR